MAEDVMFNPQEGAYEDLLLKQAALVNSIAHLFKKDVLFTPTPATELTTYNTWECDFDNYAAKTLATWPNIMAAGGTQWLLTAALQIWVWHNTGPGKGNDVGGMYVVDALGKLRGVIVFGDPVGMGSEFASLPKIPSVLFQN